MLPSHELPRVLLDECLPRKLKHYLINCTVVTVPEMGWAGKKNGELMQLAYQHFDVFITTDQNLHYQQNLVYAEIAVVVLIAKDSRLETLLPLTERVNLLLQTVIMGQVYQVEDDHLIE